MQGLVFEQEKSTYSVGSHVRDAAAYLCWSMSRAFSEDILKPFLSDLAKALVTASLFDRELNVRRAASAAFQECVGRLGTLPHGIDIINTLDYFSVGNRRACFVELAEKIAKMSFYRDSVLSRITASCGHWDMEMRELASLGLQSFCHLDFGYIQAKLSFKLIQDSLSPNSHLRHGSLLALCVLVDHANMYGMSIKILNTLSTLPITVMADFSSYLHTFNSDTYLGTLCRFIGLLARSDANLCESDLNQFISLLWLGLKRPNTRTQEDAGEALGFMVLRFQELRNEIYERLRTELNTSNEISDQCGMLLALCRLTISSQQEFDSLTFTLTSIFKSKSVAADVKRAAMRALSMLASRSFAFISGNSSDAILKAAVQGLNDYTIDNRGDVGSWVRQEAIRLVLLYASKYQDHASSISVSSATLRQIVGAFIRISVERLDSLRENAASGLAELLLRSRFAASIDDADLLKSVFKPDCDWMKTERVYQQAIPLAVRSKYQKYVLFGVSRSLSGLSQSLALIASNALTGYLKSVNICSQQALLDALIDQIVSLRTGNSLVSSMFEALLTIIQTECVELSLVTKSWLTVQREIVAELRHSSDLRKLTTAIKLYSHLIDQSLSLYVG